MKTIGREKTQHDQNNNVAHNRQHSAFFDILCRLWKFYGSRNDNNDSTDI